MGMIETITPAEPGYRDEVELAYVLSVDLGQSADPTAVAVIEHRKTFKHHFSGVRRQTRENFNVRHLQRLPLGLSYPAVVQEVAMLAARKPIAGQCEVIIDETGVGRAVGDIFDQTGLRPTRVTITAGLEQTWTSGHWHVSKQILISTLDARLHCGELGFAPALLEAPTLKEELKDFRRHVSTAGRYTFEARTGKHDDLVLACAIGLWCCVGRPVPPPPRFGSYGM